MALEATARRLADAGAQLALGARREDRLTAELSALGARVIWRGTDVADRASVVGPDVRVTVISPGAVTTELLDTINDKETREVFEPYRGTGLSPETVAEAIAYALSQPSEVDVNEIVLRPTGQEL